jgi:hypothetical protein
MHSILSSEPLRHVTTAAALNTNRRSCDGVGFARRSRASSKKRQKDRQTNAKRTRSVPCVAALPAGNAGRGAKRTGIVAWRKEQNEEEGAKRTRLFYNVCSCWLFPGPATEAGAFA